MSCTLAVARNYYLDLSNDSNRIRTTVTSKMEQFLTLFDSFHSLTFVARDLHLRNCRRLRSDSHYRHFHFAELDLKVGLSPSKKFIFICFSESPLKMMKNAFYFILKALMVLKIFKFLSWHLGHVEGTVWLER